MFDTQHRTWPLPRRGWRLRMKWHDLLFMHWPVEADLIQSLLPDPLQVDRYQGQAWIGVVPFRMSGVAPRGVPDVPGLSAFPELNVRTYVTDRGEKPGVWFFSLDATSKIAVRAARTFFHLRYMDADISCQRVGEQTHYVSRRTHHNEPSAELDVRYQPLGEPFSTKPGSLEHWLTARYCLYCASGDRVYRGEIAHDPWTLRHARCEIVKNTMTEGVGISLPRTDPLLHHAEFIKVVAWTNDRIDPAV